MSNLYANTGHGSKGWTYSWGSAVLLAKVETKQYCSRRKYFVQIVCGENIENINPASFDPRRFHPLRRWTGN